MALTTTYSVAPLLERIFPAADPASNSDTVALTGGGFATVADVPGGVSVPIFYDAAGNQQPQLIASFAPDAKIAQLTDGTVAIVGTHSGVGIDLVMQTATGIIIGPSTISVATASNPDVAAVADGVVVAYQVPNGGANNDILIYKSTSGDSFFTFGVDSSPANDQNASVAGLADGGVAVAWERMDAGGNSAIWYAVYNHDGSVRKPPAELSAGHQANVTALQSGGFAIGLASDVFLGGQTDALVASFDSAGQLVQSRAVGQLPTDDSEVAVTQLSNGMVLSTFTNLFDAVHDDHDIRGALYDPVTGYISDPADPLKIDYSADDNSQSSVSAFGLAQFVVSYSSNTSGDVTQKTFQLVRTVTGDAAADSFTGDDAVDIVNGLGGSDNLAGGANNDTLNGGDGNDYLVGGNGNDTLNGGTGADALLGGAGNDAYFVDNASDVVDEGSAALGAGIDTVNGYISINLADTAQFIGNIDNVALRGPTSINATGNGLNNTLTGNSGNNILNGGAGADHMIGAQGNDSYYVDNAGDVVNEGSMFLGAGVDTVNGYISINLADTAHFIGNIDNVALRSAANINGTGNSIANTITGNSGNNIIDGMGGADTMSGAQGNDTYYVDNAGDHVIEANGQGTDNVQAYVSFNLSGQELENLQLRSAASINGTGNSIANIINGNSGNNIIDGLLGGDTMSGAQGNDTYYVDNAGDHVIEVNGQGTDNVQAYVSFNLSGQELENLQLRSAASINGTGNSIGNTITGNSGANVINGLGGNDTLSGSTGHDSFVFTTALNASTNVDHITDFSIADDTIQVDNAIFAALGGNGTLTAAAFHIGAVATTAAQHILYDSANGWLSYDADGNGAGAASHFATLTMGLAMTNNDFLVV
ncbi:calcium-binding protein [Mesorhizobium kowhaii]|uniref:calcium-binding protein n=1 Tax=Mesorhizobium kowhaii TaxID=1300272 RepID=UPI0035E820D3